MKQKILICIIAAFLLAAPCQAQDEPSTGAKVVDVALVRPLSAAGSVVSTAVYVVLSPIFFVCGVGEPVARVMVEAPWRFTSSRHLGEYNHYVDEKPITVVHHP